MELADHFRENLSSFDLEALDASRNIIYGLDSDMHLTFLNEEWSRSAKRNGADEAFFRDWHLGARVDRAWPDELAPFYRDGFQTAAESGEPWEHEYLCPAPSIMRDYKLRVLPLELGGWLVIHIEVARRPHDYDEEHPEVSAAYRHDDGLYRQCSHCGRFRRPESDDTWDWVPGLFEDPPDRTSHGLCEMCFGFYYGDTE